MNKITGNKMYAVVLMAGIFALFSFHSGLYAGSSNNTTDQEKAKQIKQIEEAENLDQELGVNEGVKPKPVEKAKDPEYLEQQLQGRQGFQQQPDFAISERR